MAIRTIPGRFSTNYHVLFQMQTKNCEFRTKIMAGQIRKNGNLSFFENQGDSAHLKKRKKKQTFSMFVGR